MCLAEKSIFFMLPARYRFLMLGVLIDSSMIEI